MIQLPPIAARHKSLHHDFRVRSDRTFVLDAQFRRDGLLDRRLLAEHAIGWEELEPQLERCTPGWGERITGVPAAARRTARPKPSAPDAPMIVTPSGVDTRRSI